MDRLCRNLGELEERVAKLEEETKSILERNKKKEKEITHLRADEETKISQISQEMEDRSRRRTNLIISGIQEVAGSIEERKAKTW